MRPYYEHNGITIYHGDCRTMTITADAVITDPPYGVNERTMRLTNGRSHAAASYDFPAVTGDAEPFDPRWLLALGRPMILWGANHYAHRLPPASSWLIWDKREGGTPDDNADCELAWSNVGGPARLYSHLWRGMVKRSERDQSRQHPTQKPIALMRWCLSFVDGCILDPFMGIGATLVAAKSQSRQAIGIEIDERYCEIAASRLSQDVLPFEPTTSTFAQPTLFEATV